MVALENGYEVILFLNLFTIIEKFSMRRVMRRVMPASLQAFMAAIESVAKDLNQRERGRRARTAQRHNRGAVSDRSDDEDNKMWQEIDRYRQLLDSAERVVANREAVPHREPERVAEPEREVEPERQGGSERAACSWPMIELRL